MAGSVELEHDGSLRIKHEIRDDAAPTIDVAFRWILPLAVRCGGPERDRVALSHGLGTALLIYRITISEDKVRLVVVGHVEFQGIVYLGFEFLGINHAMRDHDVRNDLVIWERSSRDTDGVCA